MVGIVCFGDASADRSVADISIPAATDMPVALARKALNLSPKIHCCERRHGRSGVNMRGATHGASLAA